MKANHSTLELTAERLAEFDKERGEAADDETVERWGGCRDGNPGTDGTFAAFPSRPHPPFDAPSALCQYRHDPPEGLQGRGIAGADGTFPDPERHALVSPIHAKVPT